MMLGSMKAKKLYIFYINKYGVILKDILDCI